MSQAAKFKGGPGAIELPRSPAPLVKANEHVFVHFERLDLDRAERYLSDFASSSHRATATSCSCAGLDR